MSGKEPCVRFNETTKSVQTFHLFFLTLREINRKRFDLYKERIIQRYDIKDALKCVIYDKVII